MSGSERAAKLVLHPQAVRRYLDAVERLQHTLVELQAGPERRLLRELINGIIIHADGRHEIRGRLAALMGSPKSGGLSGAG